MSIIADLHTHTLVSNHAFNTLTEMTTQANKLGLFAMAVTDHGPELP
ncbi:MAG: PHP domain-containing protein, partial [Ruthenibacterium sp.]